MGLGLGLTYTPTMAIMTHYFKRRRGLATGIALTGLSIGATVFPISKYSDDVSNLHFNDNLSFQCSSKTKLHSLRQRPFIDSLL
jgi:MFS family permease